MEIVGQVANLISFFHWHYTTPKVCIHNKSVDSINQSNPIQPNPTCIK